MWRTSNAPLRHGNEVGLLKNGPATYEDRLAAIGRARRWVHLENYIFADDSVGQRFPLALSGKACQCASSTTGTVAPMCGCRTRSGGSYGARGWRSASSTRRAFIGGSGASWRATTASSWGWTVFTP